MSDADTPRLHSHRAALSPPPLPRAIADGDDGEEFLQYHFSRDFGSRRPDRDRAKMQAKLDRRFGRGSFVLLEDDRPGSTDLYLSENPDGPFHQPHARVRKARAVVAKRFGEPHAVTMTVHTGYHAQSTAWRRLLELREGLPDEVKVWMQPGVTPNSVLYQVARAAGVDSRVLGDAVHAAMQLTEEQRLADRLLEYSWERNAMRDPDGTRFVDDGFDPVREYSIDKEASVLDDVAARLNKGTLTLDDLQHEVVASRYYDDAMSTHEVQRLSDRDLGAHEGERDAWGYIGSTLEQFLPLYGVVDLAVPVGEEERPDPSVVGAGRDGPLPAEATWSDYVNAHGGLETSGWWVTLDWVVDSVPQPEALGPYRSHEEAVAAMQDSLLIEGFAEDTKRQELLDDVYVTVDASTINHMCDRYDDRVTVIDPRDPNHFGASGSATPLTSAGSVRSGLLQTGRSGLLQSGALHAPLRLAADRQSERVSETGNPSPRPPQV